MHFPATGSPKSRLGYIDWMRGLAAAIMLQGHVFDGWVRPQDRGAESFWLSQFLGGLPAPIFLFLVGVSLALVLDKLRSRNVTPVASLWKIVRRASWILVLAYAFRLVQYLEWYPSSRWSDVFRVDTLNSIGACTLLIGLLSLPFRSRRMNALMTGLAAAIVVATTPFVYVWSYPGPAFVQTYINGNGDASYFSVIPWIAFGFAGMTFGLLLSEARDRGVERRFFTAAGLVGMCAYAFGSALNLSPAFQYGYFDYAVTSPYFFLVRLGYLLLILFAAYHWSLRSSASRWSPLKTLGQASLIVYWLHIEIVYGRLLSQLGLGLGRALTLSQAALNLLWLVPLMIFIAWVRINWRSIREKAFGLIGSSVAIETGREAAKAEAEA